MLSSKIAPVCWPENEVSVANGETRKRNKRDEEKRMKDRTKQWKEKNIDIDFNVDSPPTHGDVN